MIGPVFSLRRELIRQLQFHGDGARLSAEEEWQDSLSDRRVPKDLGGFHVEQLQPRRLEISLKARGAGATKFEYSKSEVI